MKLAAIRADVLIIPTICRKSKAEAPSRTVFRQTVIIIFNPLLTKLAHILSNDMNAPAYLGPKQCGNVKSCRVNGP